MTYLVNIEGMVKCVNEELTKTGYYGGGAGTIVTYNWVLTAGHVVEDKTRTVDGVEMFCTIEEIDIIAGLKDVLNGDADDAQTFTTREINERVIFHSDHDVALIDVSSDPFWPSPTVSRANLLKPGMFWNSNVGVKCVVQGWGVDEIVEDENGRLQYSDEEPTHARQGYFHLLKKSRYIFKFGCETGNTCPRIAPGDSGSPVVCALNKDDDPLVEGKGHVFAVLSFVRRRDLKFTSDDYAAGTDVRVIEAWMNSITGEKNGLIYNVLSYVCFYIGC